MTQFTRIPSLQPKIEAEIQAFTRLFPESLKSEIVEILLTGSCSRAEATYRSDIDLLIILRNGPLNYQRVKELRDELDRQVFAHMRELTLEFHVHFVLSSVRETHEPAMREAISRALTILKPTEEA